MSEYQRAWIAQWPRALFYARKGKFTGSKLGVTLFCNLGSIFFNSFLSKLFYSKVFRFNFFRFVTNFSFYKISTKNQFTMMPYPYLSLEAGLHSCL